MHAKWLKLPPPGAPAASATAAFSLQRTQMTAICSYTRGQWRPPSPPSPCWRPAPRHQQAAAPTAADTRRRRRRRHRQRHAHLARRIRCLLEELCCRASTAGRICTPEQKNQVLDDLINMQLVAAQASKDGLDKDPDTAGAARNVRMRILADGESQKFLKDQEPTDAELHAEYDTPSRPWTRPSITRGTSWSPRTRRSGRAVDQEAQGRREIRGCRQGTSPSIPAPRPTAATSAGSTPRTWSSRLRTP